MVGCTGCRSLATTHNLFLQLPLFNFISGPQSSSVHC